tara:strand:- start:2046 stop:2705 length:660 start_codon:yes stop_codon:yes gene_type:complete
MSSTKSIFNTLSSVNVNKYVEKKNNLTYLSWPYAWAETCKVYPDATYTIYENAETKENYDYDPDLGFLCKTSVTIGGKTLPMWLPVMDGSNKVMKKQKYTHTTRFGEKEIQSATMFDINKTIMRCLVKNLAMFGMGVYIYAGEDMPMVEAETKKEDSKLKVITLDVDDDNYNTLVLPYIQANVDLGLEQIVKNLKTKYKINSSVVKDLDSKLEEFLNDK